MSNTVKIVNSGEVRKMSKKGVHLIIQGCGGDLREWVDGITGMLKEDGIMNNSDSVENVYRFDSNGICNLIFSNIDKVANIGKLAMWRLRWYSQFNGMWLDDYVHNYMNDIEEED